ncbi:hypothetical protein GHV40_01020 [Devosia sp. D6-9]|nr:hypothetical protein GHV40_01020 [Devosia sp. D6-9]
MSETLDLLGDPIPDGFGKRGRPEHRVTDEKRRLVMQLQAFDWSDTKIAAALSITPPTLRKHYFRELKAKAEARARVEGKLLASLMDQAEAGNVTAIDKYFKRLDRHDLKRLAEEQQQSAPADRTKMGKKQQQLEAAHDVRGKFAPPSPPRLVN